MERQEEALALLERHFGFRRFLDGQEEAIGAILDGEDALIVMPTGGGKSLCYQLPAMMLDGIAIVVSPLIALMKDQVDGLLEKKLPATFINSSLGESAIAERIGAMRRGEFRLVYVAPERFKSKAFVEALAPLTVSLFAIDEAHCISQWGHDFRPDYLRLKWVLKELGTPQVVALTATATPEVRADIVAQLDLGHAGRRQPRVFVSGFARRNLTLAVTHAKNRAAKMDRILDVILRSKTGIVYCATRKNVERVASELSAAGHKSVIYHGGMDEAQRTGAQDRFMSGECHVAVATNAFGMGVDRADLRFVLHYDLPGSMEAYYQEAGRAGRDGEPAHCELLFNYADVRTQEFFIEGANPTREILADLHGTLLRLCGKGPVAMSISHIAAEVAAAKNEMTVGTGLHLLERAGFIRREYAQGGRTYTTSVVQPVKPLKDLPIDFDKLDEKRQRDMAKLRRMIDYPDHRGCRHHFILDYFGDSASPSHCGACDNCLARASATTREPNAVEKVSIQKALCCVGRMKGQFGRGRVTQTLVGSRSREVLDAGLDRLSTYGLLASEGADYVWNLLDSLIRADCIAVSDTKYPTLSLTPLGYEVARGAKTVPLLMPSLQVGSHRPQPTAERKRSKRDRSEPSYRGPVFEALREWRREKAIDMGNIPPYLIYTDKTLSELTRLMPVTELELMEVRGIGPAKIRQFGVETLALLRSLKKTP